MANIIQFGQQRQEHKPATASNENEFKPFITSKRRVAIPPPMKVRIMRKFFELCHDVRKIARDERMPEAVVNQSIREKYWADRKGDGSGPIPTGALRVARLERDRKSVV